MRTVEISIYTIDELEEQAQKHALDNNSGILVDYQEWYEGTYEEANKIGLSITGFHLASEPYCKGEFNDHAVVSAELIKKEHGNQTAIYKEANDFLEEWDKILDLYSDGITKNIIGEDNIYNFEQETAELEKCFLKDLCEYYRIMLQQTYEWLQSAEPVTEYLRINNYEFTADGENY